MSGIFYYLFGLGPVELVSDGLRFKHLGPLSGELTYPLSFELMFVLF